MIKIEYFVDIEIKKELLEKVVNNIEYNQLILSYYKRLEKEEREKKDNGDKFSFNPDIIKNKIENIENCNKWWLLDRFERIKVKNFKKTSLCKDKFCNNCKKVKQSQRIAKYVPELEKYKDNLYHLVLTVPSVCGYELKETIKKMSKSFRKLMYYLRGDRVIKGYEWLSELGYLGAVRSLEVTFKEDLYHPHYHIALILNEIKKEKYIKKYINTYSYSFGELKNIFSEVEIIIQKIWYLIFNDEKVVCDNINKLEIGYSCKLNKFKENDYKELFKYLIKGQEENSNNFSYENFKVLYEALYNVKQIQGYGVLYKIDDNIDEDLFADMYNEFIDELYKIDIPISIAEKPSELLNDNEYILISKKSYINYLRKQED